MARILITGSTQGLGRAAAMTLLQAGHRVVVHARDTSRAATLTDLVDRGVTVVIGDLASAAQTHRLADQVNQVGRMDVVIHNAGVYGDAHRHPSPEGHPRVLGVETEEEEAQLRDLGCELGQGYYFAKPLPRAQAEDFVRHARDLEAADTVGLTPPHRTRV